jgi:hypothetical protein
MDEWLSYSLTDLLLFSPFSYFRLYEISNKDLWPWQIPILLVVVSCAWLFKRENQRPAWLLLATLWAFVAWWFFHRYYSQIYPTAGIFSALFVIEAVLLLLIAFGGQRWFGELQKDSIGRIGWILFLYALLFHPLLILLMGHSASGVELFGIAPDPTALGTLGLLLSRRGRVVGLLAVLPLLWLLISSLTHLAMESPYGLIAPLVGCMATVITVLVRRMNSQTN